MSESLINVIIQLVSGAIGGNAVAAGAKKYTLGTLGNTIAGAIGGLGGGQLLQALLGAGAAAGTASAGGLDIGALIAQVIGGGAGGAILTFVAGLIRQSITGHKTV